MTNSLMRIAVVIALALPATAGAQQIKQVEVINPPEVQDVFVTNPSTPARFQLVGFTMPDYTGDLGGPLGANQTCQDEGFEGSRMCTTPEVMGTVDIPEGLDGTAWVRPIAVGDDGRRDVSGFGSVQSCSFWTSSAGIRGLAVRAQGAISEPFCNVMRSIACCAPVP